MSRMSANAEKAPIYVVILAGEGANLCYDFVNTKYIQQAQCAITKIQFMLPQFLCIKL